MFAKFLVTDGQFRESRRCASSYFTQGRKWVFIHTCHIYYSIWVELSIRALHIILLSVCDFCENRHRRRPYFSQWCVSPKCTTFWRWRKPWESLWVASRSAQFAILLCIMWMKFVLQINAIDMNVIRYFTQSI